MPTFIIGHQPAWFTSASRRCLVAGLDGPPRRRAGPIFKRWIWTGCEIARRTAL
jgi:hypothetical protein